MPIPTTNVDIFNPTLPPMSPPSSLITPFTQTNLLSNLWSQRESEGLLPVLDRMNELLDKGLLTAEDFKKVMSGGSDPAGPVFKVTKPKRMTSVKELRERIGSADAGRFGKKGAKEGTISLTRTDREKDTLDGREGNETGERGNITSLKPPSLLPGEVGREDEGNGQKPSHRHTHHNQPMNIAFHSFASGPLLKPSQRIFQDLHVLPPPIVGD